ncbi:MAG: WD40 repeat domain-containing protein [Candidatus Babeliales bacterium]
MNAFKQILLILSVFCPALPINSMTVISLQSKCINTIVRNFDTYTPEEIAQLPEDSRKVLILKKLIETFGAVSCKRHSHFGIRRQAQTQRQGTGPVYAAAATLDNKIIAGTYDHVYVWGMDGEKIATCKGHSSAITSVAVSKDNKIISGSYDKTIRVWDMDGHQIKLIEGHSDAVTAVAISLDNKIISGSRDNTIRIWDRDGIQRASCVGHTGPIVALAISHDNKIISSSGDKTIRVWDMDGNQRALFDGHYSPLIAVTSDNKIIVGACGRSSMSVWDIEGNFLGELFCELPSGVSCLAITYDNKIVCACTDGNAYIFDMDCNQLAICRGMPGEETNILSLAVSKDNKIILGCMDHSGRVFDMNFLNCVEKINEQQALRILRVLRNSSREFSNGRTWEMIKKIINEPETNAKASMSDEVQEAISVPALIASAQTPPPARKNEFQRKVKTQSLNSDQKFALGWVIVLAGYVAYKLFVSSSDNSTNH